MQKTLLLLLLLTFIGSFSYAQSDNQSNNPELEITEKGKRLEATIACLDRLEAPTKYNVFAEQFVTLPNFPKKNSSVKSEELKNKIDSFFKEHPSLIDEVRNARKKAHDKLYGPRPY